MLKIQNKTSWNPIRNLLVVLFAGVLCAFIFAFFMLYYYGPTGRYLLSNALLSPETLLSLSFDDPDAPGSGALRYKFDRLEYTFWDPEKKQWQQKPLTPADYSKLYQKITDDKSIIDEPADIANQFYTSKLSRLTIYVKATGGNLPGAGASGKPLQVVEFSSSGDYYRVELRGSKGVVSWAYFYNPEILHNLGQP